MTMPVPDPRVEAGPITSLASACLNPSPFMLLTDISWLWRLQICIILLWLCTLWTHQMVLPLRPGWRRLVAAVPAVTALIAAPFLFHPFNEPILSMTTAFMSVRMPVTKLLAACYSRGPLAALPTKPRAHGDATAHGRVPALPLVTFFMLCPVVPRVGRAGERGDGKCEGRTPEGPNCGGDATNTYYSPSNLHRTHSSAYRACGDRRRLLRGLAGKWLAFTFTSALAVRYGNIAPLAVHAALAYGMLAIMGGMMDLTALYCTIWWDVDLVPPFHNPFQATSLSDFWAHRWNVTQSRVLKGLLYDPIVEGRLVPEEAEEAAGHHRHLDRGANSRGGGSGGSSGSGSGAGDEGITGNVNATGGGGGGSGGDVLQDGGSGDCVASGAEHKPQVTLYQNACRRRLVSAFAVQQHERVSDGGDIDADGGGLDARPREQWIRGVLSKPNAPGLGGAGAINLAPQGPSETKVHDGGDGAAASANPAIARTPVPHIAFGCKPEAANGTEGGGGGGTSADVHTGRGGGGDRSGWGDERQRRLRGACRPAAIALLASAAAAVAAAAPLSNVRVRRMVALLVVFAFSGIEHE
ncbi:hypothetical protein VaNZ11_003648, partial [Volvox africanus]